MHSHPYLDETSLEKIGIWEESGEIVGVAHYESRLGEAFFEAHPKYRHLKPEMLEYAESHLYGESEDGKKYLRAYVNDFDQEFERLVESRGYENDDSHKRPMFAYVLPPSFSPPHWPTTKAVSKQ